MVILAQQQLQGSLRRVFIWSVFSNGVSNWQRRTCEAPLTFDSRRTATKGAFSCELFNFSKPTCEFSVFVKGGLCDCLQGCLFRICSLCYSPNNPIILSFLSEHLFVTQNLWPNVCSAEQQQVDVCESLIYL